MHVSRRRLLQATALAGLATTGLSGCASPPPKQAIDEFLTDTVPDGAGLTVGVLRHGELLYAKGFGYSDHENKVKSGMDTVYDIGSNTKQFTAAAVVALETDGALSVTDTLGEHLPGLPPEKAAITLHQLLTHTAGMPDALGDDYDPLTMDDLIAAVADVQPKWEPGAGYLYSNVGYSLLAAVVAEVSGAGYEPYLADRLFAPAGMTSTGYLLPEWDDTAVAIEYDADSTGHGRPRDHPWDDDGPYWNLRGNGGILSTVTDMTRWLTALSSDAVLPGAGREKLFEPYVQETGEPTHYGYGWVIDTGPDDRPVAWHNGGNDRSYAEIYRSLRTDFALFWAANQASSADWDLEELDLTGGIAEAAG